jgi:hypothetical protein
MVRCLGTQPVGHGRQRRALRVPHVPRGQLPGQRRELMHDHLRFGGRHRRGHGIGVESVGHHRARAQATHQVLLRRVPRHPDHLVAPRHELRNQRSAKNTCGPSYKDLHEGSSRLLPLRPDGAAVCDNVRRSDSRRSGRRRGTGSKRKESSAPGAVCSQQYSDCARRASPRILGRCHAHVRPSQSQPPL